MAKIAVVTDSIADIPEDLVREFEIHVVPVWLNFKGKSFRDGMDISHKEVYRILRENDEFPTASAPSIGDFLQAYTQLSGEVEGIVSIHVSSKLSATYSAALAASQLVEDMPIWVVDSCTAALSEGFVVLEAARAAAKGCGLDTILQRVKEVIPKVNLLVTFDTLKYLPRSGRVPAVAALVGSLLKVNPIVHIEDGLVKLLEKPRTKVRAVQRIMDIMAGRIGASPAHIGVIHADAPEEAGKFGKEIVSRFNCVELIITEFTPVMGAFTGPGSVGVAFWAEGTENV